jgi:hypothetical protein
MDEWMDMMDMMEMKESFNEPAQRVALYIQ